MLARSVRRLDPDVLGVQEADHKVVRSWFADQPALIASAADATDRVYAPARRVALTGSDGVALCVRGTIHEHHVMRFRGRSHRQDRVAILARVGVGERSVTVAATHLQNDAEEAKDQLAELLEAVARWPAPRVVLGDLNLGADDVAGRRFTMAGGPPSSPSARPTLRIDHVLVDGFTIGAVDVPWLPVSDHRAVVAELVHR
jgi:endonuclease/exonuclease/phosphatase family metal-dependent hydrolase